jgi:Ca-activated chloride channel family protein
MNGWPIRQAAAAIERGLKRLGDNDTFQIINFDQSSSQLGPAPLPATGDNIRKGIDYLRAIQGQGGTQMLSGLRAALDFPHDPKRLRFVCFLTDGFIGNEPDIIGELQSRLGESRIFSFGVGTSVNRYLIDAMAKVGRGCVAHVAAGDSPDQIMDRFFDRISRPALTDVSIDFGTLQVDEVYPRQFNDVFVGRAMVVHGRLRPGAGLSDAVVTIRGNSGGEPATIEVPFTVRGIVPPQTHPALAKVWARAKLADIADHATPSAMAESVGQIREVALGYGLMSAFTSFIAVDSLAPTAGAFGTTVAVPVPVPEGVRYETTVPER